MSIVAWRIVKRQHQNTAFSGEGARLYGGRWNPAGVPLIYTAESISLAALEIWVHLTKRQLLRDSFVTIPITFDPRHSQSFDRRKLPRDWASFPPPASTQAIGLNWASGMGSAALKVPSTIIPQEHIYLVNPKHPDFAKMTIDTPQKLIVDPRLGKA